MEHDILIGLDVVHIDALHFLLASWVIGHAIPADMSEEESATEVEGILDSLSIFVMNAMDLNPLVDGALLRGKEEEKRSVDKRS